MTWLEDARELATLLAQDGVTRAYTDPRKAFANRPCVLVAPPLLDFTGGTMTGPSVIWRLLALSSHHAAAVEALDELEELVSRTDAVLTVERAEPIQYPVGDSRIAAYLITLTTL